MKEHVTFCRYHTVLTLTSFSLPKTVNPVHNNQNDHTELGTLGGA